MARGNFRSDRLVCLYCGKREPTVARGGANNPMFLCLSCAEKFDHAYGKQTEINQYARWMMGGPKPKNMR